MISPHTHGTAPYQDKIERRQLYEEEIKLIMMGYKFLGWDITHDTVPEYGKCVDSGHSYRSYFPYAWHMVKHTPSGSDTTQWCTKCKIYWKVDIS